VGVLAARGRRIILFPSILTESLISSTTLLCWIKKRLSYISSVGLTLVGTLCCWLLLAVDACVFRRECFGWYHRLILLVFCCLACCGSRSLCPPLSIELYVGTILHTVATASTYNTKVLFPSCIVQRVFFSRAWGPYNFFASNSK
jgi:hypothetical protein